MGAVQSLDKLGDILKELSERLVGLEVNQGCKFSDVHSSIREYVATSLAEIGTIEGRISLATIVEGEATLCFTVLIYNSRGDSRSNSRGESRSNSRGDSRSNSRGGL